MISTIWATLLFVAPISLQYVADAIDLQQPLPNSTRMFPGIFSDGGFYRMIVYNTEGDHNIKYGDLDIVIAPLKQSNVIYIEEYHRGENVFFELNTQFADGEYRSYKSVHFKVIHGKPSISNNFELYNFIQGPVLLYVDVSTSASVHPRIWKTVSADGCRITFEFMSLHRYMERPCWRGKPGFLMSTIVNTDFRMERPGVVTSSVLFYSERIIIDLNSKPYRYTLECKDQFYSVEPLSGIVKAKNPFRSTEMLWKPNSDDEDTSVKERVSITIDVATILSTSPNVIAVLNVKRGSWSYFVYEVVLFTSVKIVDVLVENSENSITIYNNPPDALIARVERYCHDVTSAEYVVVHEFRKGSSGLLPRTHILELVETDGKKIYEEVYKQRKKHIEMVTNSIRDEQSS